MQSAEIRRRFLEYFERHGHTIVPSSGLVPADDPTLLFTNAGMVQFKRVFLGQESPGYVRATTSQKCLRVSGKHNDLEEVGVTARHHTFFEMLGNFSFGDYFKRDAIRFAWELLTEEYGIPRERLWATVHYTDDEAFELWQEVAGLSESRIFRLGDKDNFWQMGDTGPCGPCSELHYDLRPEGARGTEVTQDEFIELGKRGDFLELWNLVFMQFERRETGELDPLPKPSIDTGAGLERITSALQDVDSNYKTDLFLPLIERAVERVGVPYEYASAAGVSYRVLADHARATAFLIADGVFPTNEGRGYVLRRVMRRAVRHAWLLGRREPTLVDVVEAVIDTMGDSYPQLRDRRDHILRATRDEEARFFATIEEGMSRIALITPASEAAAVGTEAERPRVSGEDVFRLYDTHGFPLDLTELIARERGYELDVDGFEAALEQQRERSREDRRQSTTGVSADQLAHGWTTIVDEPQAFAGYRAREVETEVLAFRAADAGRFGLRLRENPFYVESGGQISDRGRVTGKGWTLAVDDVRRLGGATAIFGALEGDFPAGEARVTAHAVVDAPERHDTERNHTATHLLHAALRKVLGEHVLQRGSLVAPDRLRFDFSHPRPMTADEIRAVEELVNRQVLDDLDVQTEELGYEEAVGRGAMALFGEKYGDVVRVVSVPGVSLELCGGTHVRHTSEIGLFRVVSESGVASGVRRIEAVTGTAAWVRAVQAEERLRAIADSLRTSGEGVERRIEQLLEQNRELERQLERARGVGAADVVGQLVADAEQVDGATVVASEVQVANPDELRALGDRLRSRMSTGAAVLAARYPDKVALFTVVTDDLVKRGVRADKLIQEVAQMTGGSGGGRPHMAQGGVGDPARLDEALRSVPEIVRALLGANV
ncbi:MAG TPA: alanine--tRNA ligase [Longimicrobiales bacterium]|nr:alanine--tRNA ligase [Longimicrobiales bacterium]